jgi:hypothetical protein
MNRVVFPAQERLQVQLLVYQDVHGEDVSKDAAVCNDGDDAALENDAKTVDKVLVVVHFVVVVAQEIVRFNVGAVDCG